MSFAFPPPVPMSISVLEYLLHLLVFGFLLGAAFGIVPPSRQMTVRQARIRSALVGTIVLVFGYVSVEAGIEFFTSIELWLGVIAIIRLMGRAAGWPFSPVLGGAGFVLGAVLSWFAIIGPAYKVWYDSLWTQRPVCRHGLKNTALAMHNWSDDHEGKLPDAVTRDGDGPGRSWRVAVLPLLDQGPLQTKYSVDDAWDAPANEFLAQVQFHPFRCESNRTPVDEFGRHYTNQAVVTGPKTAFPGGKGMALDAIGAADGSSQTILIGECSGLNIVWWEPRDIDVSKQKIGINLPGDRPRYSSSILSSYHPRGAHAAMADGSVRFLSEKMAPKVLQALTTATGGENVPDDGSW